MNFSGIRDLVLGGGGLIGSALVDSLRADGHKVTSLDLSDGVDLRSFDLTASLMECDCVWFLAWDTGGVKYIESRNLQVEQFKNNCQLSMNILDAIGHAKKPFLFTSTQLTVVPNAYGVTKLMAETWAMELGGKVARLWNTYGWERPDIKSHVVTDLVLAGLTKGRVETLTTGNERRRFIYKSDCVSALRNLFDSERQKADIAGGRWITIRELAEEVARQLDAELVLGENMGTEHIIDPQYLLPNWSAQITLKEGLALVIRDAREYLERQ